LRAAHGQDRWSSRRAISADGRVQGTYVHGLFTAMPFAGRAGQSRHRVVSGLRVRIEGRMDALADIWKRISTSSKS